MFAAALIIAKKILDKKHNFKVLKMKELPCLRNLMTILSIFDDL